VPHLASGNVRLVRCNVLSAVAPEAEAKSENEGERMGVQVTESVLRVSNIVF
jgi:hypothetical protein